WLDGFLPISDTGTDVDLVVDLRDGELNGCVGEFSSDGGLESPYWMSIREMLADVADALTLDRPALVGYARRQQAASPYAKGSVRWPYLIDDEDDANELRWSIVDVDDQRVMGAE
ncbi:MAG TPA: hypothetical protein VFI00_11390, partial [Kribbella sp.]|nr:hypothetical protein [Kribbella sp.]